MEKLISIIVPTKNAEKTVLRTLISIQKQTYKDFEVICVDSSQDKTFEIISSFAKQDNRFKPIKVSFDGLARQRNHGVSLSNGDLITFIDGDDTINQKYLSLLLNSFDSETDIVCGNFIRVKNEVDENKALLNDVCLSRNKISACLELENNRGTQMTLCQGKLIKKELLLSFPIDEEILNEDEASTYKWYINSKKIVILESQIYNYYVNENSLSYQHNEKLIQKASGLCKTYEDRFNAYKTLKNKKLIFKGWLRLMETSLAYAFIFKKKKDKENQKEMLSYYRNNYGKKYMFSHALIFIRIFLKYIRAR